MGSLAESEILLHFELHSRLDHYEWMFLYIYRWSANAHARTLARTPVPKLNHNKILSPWPTAMFVPERLPRKLLKSSEAAVVFNFTALHCIACAFVCVCVCVGCRCWCECMRESEPTSCQRWFRTRSFTDSYRRAYDVSAMVRYKKLKTLHLYRQASEVMKPAFDYNIAQHINLLFHSVFSRRPSQTYISS